VLADFDLVVQPLNTKQESPIIFPNSFKVKNNIISDGNIELEIGQKNHGNRTCNFSR